MVGILLSYWGGLFSRAMLVSGRVSLRLRQINRPFFPSWLKWPFHFSWLRVSRLLWQGFFRSIMKPHAHQNILWTSLDAIQQKRCSKCPCLLTFGQKKLFQSNWIISPERAEKCETFETTTEKSIPIHFLRQAQNVKTTLPKIWCSYQFPSKIEWDRIPTDP